MKYWKTQQQKFNPNQQRLKDRYSMMKIGIQQRHRVRMVCPLSFTKNIGVLLVPLLRIVYCRPLTQVLC